LIILIIKNFSQLISKNLLNKQTELRKIGLNCIEIAIDTIKPEKLVKNSVKIIGENLKIQKDLFNLRKFKNIYIIGGGKATADMALSLEDILKNIKLNLNYKGYINIPEELEFGQSGLSDKITFNYASHPIPNERGFIGVKEILNIVKRANDSDLIFCLISGGASSLMPFPRKNITLEDLKKINRVLIKSEIPIQEINIIRKYLSNLKGGKLSKIIYESSRATMIVLIISDVVGDRLDLIGSGPTLPDPTNSKDVIRILEKYKLLENIPKSIRIIFTDRFKKKNLENPKQNDPCFKNVHNYLIGSVKSALNEINKYLSIKGYYTIYFTDFLSGEAKKFGQNLYKYIKEIAEDKIYKKYNRIALIGSGELTVKIQGEGIGGRNQEMLLSFLEYIKKKKINYNLLIIGANLDGIEGNSNAMGALVDNHVISVVNNSNLNLHEYLRNNDSNCFFKLIGTEIISGSTGCNVNDIIIILILRNN